MGALSRLALVHSALKSESLQDMFRMAWITVNGYDKDTPFCLHFLKIGGAGEDTRRLKREEIEGGHTVILN